MSFRDQLRADDDIEFAPDDRVDLAPQPLRPAGEIGRQNQRARLRKRQRHFFR